MATGIQAKDCALDQVFGTQMVSQLLRIEDSSAAQTATAYQTFPFDARISKIVLDNRKADSDVDNLHFQIKDNADAAVQIRQRARTGVKQQSFIEVTGTPVAEDGVLFDIDVGKSTEGNFSVYTCVIEVDTSGADVQDNDDIGITVTGVTEQTITNDSGSPEDAATFATRIAEELNDVTAFEEAGFIAAVSSRVVSDKKYVIISNNSDFALAVDDAGLTNPAASAEVAPRAYEIAQSITEIVTAHSSVVVAASCDADPATLPYVKIEGETANVPFSIAKGTKDGTADIDVESKFLWFEATGGIDAGDFTVLHPSDEEFDVDEFDSLELVLKDEADTSSTPIEVNCSLVYGPVRTAYARAKTGKDVTLYTSASQAD